MVVERRYFQATTDRSSARAALPRLGLIALVSVMAATIGIEVSSGRHHLPAFGVVLMACIERFVGLNNIALPDAAADFVDPSLLAVGVSLFVSALYLLTRPVVDRRLSMTGRGDRTAPGGVARARDRASTRSRHTRLLRAARRQAVLLLSRLARRLRRLRRRRALISPDPIGPAAERSEAFSAFRAYAEGRGWTIGVIGASEEWLPIYGAAGLHHLYIGDEAIVDCPTFNSRRRQDEGTAPGDDTSRRATATRSSSSIPRTSTPVASPTSWS